MGFDIGPRPDAARFDAGGTVDSALDAGSSTVDSDIDAFASDSGFSPGSCVFDMTMDVVAIDSDPRAHPTRLPVAAGPTSFGIVYSKVGTDGFENVYLAQIASTPGGPMALPQQLTHDFANTLSPAISRTDFGWLIAWASNSAGTMDIFSLGTGSDGHMLGSQRLTMTAMQDQAPNLASVGAISTIAWTELDGTGRNPTTVVQHLAQDGTLTGTAQRLMPAGFTMRPQVLRATDFGYVLGWVDPDQNAYVQPLDGNGAAVGTPTSLTVMPDADGAMDAVVSGGGGAAVFGVQLGGRREVHAHLLDGAGAAIDVERVLTTGMDAGSDASIAELGGGYVVAYRQASTPPVLRVLFLSSLLDEIGRLDLGSVAATGGPTAIGVSGDGAVLVTWADVAGTTTNLRAARIRCN